MKTTSCDICVVGAGSSRFAAAVAACRNGASVLLIEAADGVGGTSTWTAAALCDGDISSIAIATLRQALRRDGVALDLANSYLDTMADIAPLAEQNFTPGQPYEINR
ncbi:MAG TPA: FAD-dependent oxidoreductase [Candidatus Latescibacteria bacterium]|nr:FAD-dependent oxidoreductase [Candidatus Handelsmanbacteria bacterium]HIL08590.1 FAD-dependent oxidoreductase [Candidatus Latescibacterota bacterium]